MGRAEHNLKRAGEERPPRSTLKVVSDDSSPDSGVRAICPFCGASNPTPEYFCCADWFAMMYPASDAEEATLRRPAWMVMPSLAMVRDTVRARLGGGSQLLVTLLASAIVAVLATLTTQWRIAAERPKDVVLASVHPAPPAIPDARPPMSSGNVPEPAAAVPPEVAPASAPPAALAPEASLPGAPGARNAQEKPAPPATAPVASGAPSAAAAPEVAATGSNVQPVAAPAAPVPAAAPVAAPRAAEPAAPAADIPAPVAALPVAAVHPRIAKLPRPATPHKVAPAVPSEPVPARIEEPPSAEPEPKVAVALQIPSESEVVARAVQEASTPWHEPSQVARLTVPTDSSHWHLLRRGMSREAVRRLLGEPRWRRHLVGTEVWLYEENSLYSEGWVTFTDPGEELTGWRGTSSTH